MALPEEEKPLLVKLYTSLRFWGGLFLLLFIVLLGCLFGSARDGDVLVGVVVAVILYLFVPSYAFFPLAGYNFFGSTDFGYMLPETVFLGSLGWLMILALVIWLRVKGSTLKVRTIKIVGTSILLFLITGFLLLCLDLVNRVEPEISAL